MDGQFNVGVMYLEGLGIESNSDIALEWFRKSLFGGNEKAQTYVNQLKATAKDTVTSLHNKKEEKLTQKKSISSGDDRIAILMAQLELQIHKSKP